MAYFKRTIPDTGLAYGQKQWAKLFDLSEKVVCYVQTAPDTVTIDAYYAKVSTANTACTALGGNYHTSINWWHSDISHISVGPYNHRDASETLPSWIDADAI